MGYIQSHHICILSPVRVGIADGNGREFHDFVVVEFNID